MEMNQEQLTRFKAGMWVMFAVFVASALEYVLQNIAMFNFDQVTRTIIVAGLTGMISQITKTLNK
jgi:hypothetical protein